MTDPCPPWCDSSHKYDGPIPAHTGSTGHAGAVSVGVMAIKDLTRVMVHAGTRCDSLRLKADDARALADLLAEIPPEELPGLVAGLRAGADLVDPPAPEGGERDG